MIKTLRAPSLRNRNWLLASAATLSLVIGGAAHAQSSAPEGSILSPQGGSVDPNVVISLPGTSTSDIDTTNITGVGQIVTDDPARVRIEAALAGQEDPFTHGQPR